MGTWSQRGQVGFLPFGSLGGQRDLRSISNYLSPKAAEASVKVEKGPGDW